MTDEPDYSDVLRSAALRVTRPRMAVLHAVGQHPHADTELIIRAAREQLPDISRQTVYDALNALAATGLVRRIQPAGSLARYETRVGDNHHHVVCRSCGVAHTVSGLAIVAALSRSWGSTPTANGKTVWAVLGSENRL